MTLSLPWFIGLRYIRAKRRNGFIAFVSLFAMLGMLLGVFALIVVLSVMNGFDNELKQRILKVVPHGFISHPGGLEDWQGIADQVQGADYLVGAAPYIEGKSLISQGQAIQGISLQGIDPAYEPGVSAIAESMLVGRLEYLEKGRYHIVLGRLLARQLGVSTGDKVNVTLPVLSITPAGVFPRSKRFTVIGVFEAGAQVDQSLALIHLTDAQKLFRQPNSVAGLRLRFDNIYHAGLGVTSVLELLPDAFNGKDWSHTQGSLFQAVKMEKVVVGVMLSVIIAVAAFNIVTSLIMMVAEKRSDIAVLRTLGMSRGHIVRIFVIQGTVMGCLGIALGAISGILVAQFLPELMGFFERLLGFQMFDQNVYFVSYLPSLWKASDTAWTCVLSVAISFLATIYPALRASQIEPAEALRYDM